MADVSTPRINVARLAAGLYRDDEPASDGLQIGDARLDAINDAAFRSSYEEAAALSQGVWDEGVRDVRLISYLLYGYYLERDVVALPFILEQLVLTLTTRWAHIGPTKKDKPADGALHWLFSSLIRQFDGHEKARDEQYRRWLTPDGAAAFAAAEPLFATLVAEVEVRFPKGKCFDKVRNLSGRVRDIGSSLRAPPPPAPAAEPPPAEDQAAEPAAAEPAETKRTGTNAISVEGGAALGLLLRKLRAFEELVNKEQNLKAAVIARDLEQLLAAFDPVVFFPKLFVPYFRAMIRNVDALGPVMADLEQPYFKSLVQLYHADLDAFVES